MIVTTGFRTAGARGAGFSCSPAQLPTKARGLRARRPVGRDQLSWAPRAGTRPPAHPPPAPARPADRTWVLVARRLVRLAHLAGELKVTWVLSFRTASRQGLRPHFTLTCLRSQGRGD